jgi:hypothetical protein
MARQLSRGGDNPEISSGHRAGKASVSTLFANLRIERKGRRIFHTQAAAVLSLAIK